jgi:hypothetical protein
MKQPNSLFQYQGFFLWRCDPMRVMISSLLGFLDHTQRRITVGKTPLDKWSARRRDHYLTTHNTHNRQISIPSVGFKPAISGTSTKVSDTLVNKANLVHNFFSMFISFLYMFWATMCLSSGEITVFMQHFVLVILYEWLSGMQGRMNNGHISPKTCREKK